MKRGPRAMPTLVALVDYLGLAGEAPHCYRCKYDVPVPTWEEATGWLDRAHMIDRWCGGSDTAHNLRPLCHWCHAHQPVFVRGDEQNATEWFNARRDAAGDVRAMIRESLRDPRNQEPHVQRFLFRLLRFDPSGEFADVAEEIKRRRMAQPTRA